MRHWGGPAMAGTENDDDGRPVDFDGRYAVTGMPGVAFWLHGWAVREVPESWELSCDDPAHKYSLVNEDDPECHDQACYLYNEPELVPDLSRVRAVMVGDDAVHIVDTSDLTELTEDGYCLGCGQTGCHAERLDVS